VSVTAVRGAILRDAAPYALTHIPQEAWEYGRSYNVGEALRWVPGVFVQDRSGSSDIRIVIRGFGARGAGDRSNNGTTRGVRILLDGVPLTEPDGRTALDLLEPAALTSADILRSNATLLWGNASGGVIAFQTVPTSNIAPSDIAIGAGGFGFRKLAATLSSPLSDGALAATVAYSMSNGWRQHSEARRWWVGLSLRSSLSPVTSVEIAAAFTANRFNIPGPLDWDTFLNTPEAANPTYQQQRARRENLLANVSFSLLHLPSPRQSVQVTVFAQPKFLVRSERGTYREFSRVHTGGSLLLRQLWQPSDAVSVELALGSDAAIQDGPALFYRLTSDGGRDSVMVQNKREAATDIGAFARITATIGARLSFWGGLRSEWLHYRLLDALKPSLSDQKLFRAILPGVGIGYRFSDSHSLYAHLSSGWEVPAYNEIDPPPTGPARGINPDLKPMLSWTAEIGSRHRLLFPRRELLRELTTELALFWIDCRNELVPYGGGRFYQNAARSERFGVEWRFSARTARGLTLNAMVSVSSMRYRSYTVDSSFFGSNGRADFSNNQIAGVPPTTLGVQLGYTLPMVPLAITVDFLYTGSYYADDANTVLVPDYALWNASLRLAEPMRVAGLSIAPWIEVHNLANRRYVGSVYVNPDRDAQGRTLFAEPGMPRSVTAGIRLSVGG